MLDRVQICISEKKKSGWMSEAALIQNFGVLLHLDELELTILLKRLSPESRKELSRALSQVKRHRRRYQVLIDALDSIILEGRG